MPASVFLSHQHVDKAFARKLADALIKNKVVVWIDDTEIQIGDSILGKIQEGIAKAEYFAIILSPNSLNSPWVLTEFNNALTREIKNKKVFVLPILYQECELPGFLKDKYYADFRRESDFDKSLNLLLRKLNPEILNTAISNSDPSEAKIDITFENLETLIFHLNETYYIPRYSNVLSHNFIDLVYSLSNYLYHKAPDDKEVYSLWRSAKLANDAVCKFYDSGYFNQGTVYALSSYYNTLKELALFLKKVISKSHSFDDIDYYQKWINSILQFADDFKTILSSTYPRNENTGQAYLISGTNWIFQEFTDIYHKTNKDIDIENSTVCETCIDPMYGLNIKYFKNHNTVEFESDNTFYGIHYYPSGKWYLNRNSIKLILNGYEEGYGWLPRFDRKMNVFFYGDVNNLRPTKIFHFKDIKSEYIKWSEEEDDNEDVE